MPKTADVRLEELRSIHGPQGSLEDFRHGWSLIKLELEWKLQQQDQLVQSFLDRISVEGRLSASNGHGGSSASSASRRPDAEDTQASLLIPVATERTAIQPQDQCEDHLEMLRTSPQPARARGAPAAEVPATLVERRRMDLEFRAFRALKKEWEEREGGAVSSGAASLQAKPSKVPAPMRKNHHDQEQAAYSRQGSKASENTPSLAPSFGEKMSVTSRGSPPSVLWDGVEQWTGQSLKSEQQAKRGNFRKRKTTSLNSLRPGGADGGAPTAEGRKGDKDDAWMDTSKAEMLYAAGALVDKTSKYLSDSSRRRMINLVRWWVFLQEPERSGVVARIILNKKVESIIAFVICANVGFTIYSTNYAMHNWEKQAETEEQQFINLGFLIFYGVELLTKLMVHKLFFFVNDDMKWNLFDFFLVVMSCWDWCVNFVAQDGGGASLGFMRTLRLMKMTRILRMLRVVRVFRELKTMLFTLVGSLLALFWCVVMLAFILVMFSLVFVQLITAWLQEQLEVPDEMATQLILWFGSVETSMVTLYMAATGGEDWSEFYHLLQVTGSSVGLLFLFYIAFFNFAVVNVLTGIFVEYTQRVCRKDEDLMIMEQRRKEKVDAEQLKNLVEAMDDDKSGTISWLEFDKYMYDERVAMLLASIGLDIKDAEAFFEMLMAQADSDEVEKDAFIDGCMRLKGGATSIDMQSLMYETRSIHLKQKAFSMHMLQCFEDLSSAVHQVMDETGMKLAVLPKSPKSKLAEVSGIPRQVSATSGGCEPLSGEADIGLTL